LTDIETPLKGFSMQAHCDSKGDCTMRVLRFRPILALMALFISALIPGTVVAISVPDSINLNENGKLYEPFSFNHAGHIQITKECSGCHHHTTGTLVEDPNCIRCHRNSGENKVVQCRGCHLAEPFSAEALREKDKNLKAYHQDKPGLKAALHQNCIGCHSKKAKGPTGCVDCHTLKKAGNAFYNTGEFAPKGKPGKGGH
jgi:hypothetical protein